MIDVVACEVCGIALSEDERCYRYMDALGVMHAEETAEAVELHTFCEGHAPALGTDFGSSDCANWDSPVGREIR